MHQAHQRGFVGRVITRAAQQGAALATALFFLTIITLLGLAAMRAGRTDLRLAQNEGTRVDAQQNAQSALNSVRAYSAALNVLPGSNYIQSCALGSSLNATALAAESGATFTCPVANVVAALLPNTVYKNYIYVSVKREQVNGSDYVPTSAVREGDSGDRYDLADFTITAGYDRIASDDVLPLGGAEIAQGVYVKVARIRGLSQQ